MRKGTYLFMACLLVALTATAQVKIHKQDNRFVYE